METTTETTNTNSVITLAKDLTKDYPRSPRETLGGYVIAARTLDKCRATLAGTPGEYHFDCPLDNFFFSFTEISAADFKKFVATGAPDEQVAQWIEETAKKRPRVEIIKWNNDWRYRRISEMPDPIQEFMEGYVPQFVPAEIMHHIDYFFDIYDAEEKRIQA
jgi:hypothetical protein